MALVSNQVTIMGITPQESNSGGGGGNMTKAGNMTLG
jgi:hypothetical protein